MPVFFRAQFQQQGSRPGADHQLRVSRSHNIEFNDTIRWNNFSFNVGLLASNDTLYGQGLREDANALSGFGAAPGNKYEMLNIGVQQDDPAARRRDLGLQRPDTIYASYASYNPAASSLPRAASWDRNLAVTLNARLR